jgi:hypothetical protein
VSVERVTIGGVGVGFKEGGGIAPSGISPLLSTTKASEGMADVEPRNRLGYCISPAFGLQSV